MSIQKDNVRGDYIVRVSYKKHDGTYGQKSRRVKKYSEARSVEVQLQNELNDHAPSVLTYSMCVEKFIFWKEENKRATTADSLERKSRIYISNYFKNKKISDSKKSDFIAWKTFVNKYRSERTGEPLCLNYKQQVYRLLHSMLNYAKKEFNVNAVDILESVGNFIKDPNEIVEDKELKYWTLDQFETFIESYKGSFKIGESEWFKKYVCYIYYNVLYFTGLRKGEANALLITDFHDGDNPYLSITKSINMKVHRKGSKERYLVTPPKNETSVRDVPVPKLLADILRKHIDLLSNMEDFDEKAFYLIGGFEPIADSTADTMKRNTEEKCSLPHIAIHDLRHSYASLLINNNIALPIISRLLGHASIEETWRTYSHLYPKTSSEAVEAIDRQVSNKNFAQILHQN